MKTFDKDKDSELLTSSFFNELFQLGNRCKDNVFEQMKGYMDLQTKLKETFEQVYDTGLQDGIKIGIQKQVNLKKN